MKMQAILLLFAASCLSQTKAGLIEDFFNKAFDQIRPNLTNIYQEEVSVANLTLTNLFVEGLEKFYITGLSANLLPLKINNLTIVIDDISAEGSYKMEEMTIPGNIVLSGAGDLQLYVQGLQLYIQATLSSRNQILYIKDILAISVHVDNVEIHLTGLAGGGPVGDLLNNILNLVATPVLNLLVTPALEANEEQLIAVINSILSTIKV